MGRRGFGSPLSAECFHPIPTYTQYLQQANDALLTMVQIETREALDVVDDIAAVESINVLFIGPFDLGNRRPPFRPRLAAHLRVGDNIGYPILDGVIAPELTAAMARILAACRKHGKKCGVC